MKSAFPDIARLVASIFVCVLIIVMGVNNVSIISPLIQSFIEGRTDFDGMKDQIVEAYESNNLWEKNDLVNCFGLSMKLSGRKEINKCVLLDNGMLANSVSTFQGSAEHSKQYCTELHNFSEYLKAIGSRFIFVAAPSKIDTQGEVLPVGLLNLPNEMADNLLAALTGSSVETIDLREELSYSISQIDQYFYRTDHHWNPDGAMKAFQIIMNRLAEGDPSIDTSLVNPALWIRHAKDNWFLGSHGKRVGAWCIGTDPLIWYTPEFETSMTCIIPHKKQLFKGDFEDANIRSKYIETRDYFNYNAYCVYIGGDYPYVKHLNPGAPNNQKILIIKDSFSLPLQSFLSTAFKEVEVIDPRHYTASEIAEYCLWSKPDLVLMMRYSAEATEDYANLGVKDAPNPEILEETILLSSYDVSITKSDSSNYRHKALPVDIKPGNTYRFSFDAVTLTGNESDGVTVLVYDNNSKKVIRQQIFDIFYSAEVGDKQWTFRISPEEADNPDYKLLVYAGILGSTKGISAEYSGINVSELVQR
ncbi:MAG: hypothetical protein IKH30_03140 [Clostridia bacterium]|nr:hypothetical protein [Clostridia bacterium]